MSKKAFEVASLLPKAVTDAGNVNEVTDLVKIKELLVSRTIVSAERFILPKGKYEFESVSAAEWPIGKGKNAKQAVMAVIVFKGGKMTTIGSLRKIDSKLNSYGPKDMPLNEAEVLQSIIDKGIEVTDIVETTATVFTDGDRTIDPNDASGYRTKPARIMAWKFGK